MTVEAMLTTAGMTFVAVAFICGWSYDAPATEIAGLPARADPPTIEPPRQNTITIRDMRLGRSSIKKPFFSFIWLIWFFG
jgi:hypothetical protein